MINNIEMITMARNRFYTGRINHNAVKDSVEFDGKLEIKKLVGYAKNGYVIGIEFEMV